MINRYYLLLPIYFKKIAIGIMLMTILFYIMYISKTLTIDKEIFILISKTGFLSSMLIFAMTRNKIEDEQTLTIRLLSYAGSFTGGVAYVIVSPIAAYFFNSYSGIGITELSLVMLLMYFGSFYSRLSKGL